MEKPPTIPKHGWRPIIVATYLPRCTITIVAAGVAALGGAVLRIISLHAFDIQGNSRDFRSLIFHDFSPFFQN
jgi:hypothetical protein